MPTQPHSTTKKEKETHPMKKLICLGDSITADDYFADGTPRLVPRLRAATGWTVRNAGISGDNTRDALARLQNDVLQHNADIVTIFLGTNDAAAHKMVPLPEYSKNLQTLVEQIGAEKIVFITPAPVDTSHPRNRENTTLQAFGSAVQQVAAQNNCPCIDLFAAMAALPNYPAMLTDGLHFAPEGYELLTQLILEKLAQCGWME